MKFAMFYEIPVARPWNDDSEYLAYQNTIEQAVLGDEMGFHSFWTVEHHFLEEYSHCSNPEVLYGAIAMKTKNMRLGYGVRLLPKPYNHPVRSAESAAVLDLISGGRVEFGTGRSSTRAELEGFGIHPHDTREMWQEALESHRGLLDQRRIRVRRQALVDAQAPGAAEAPAKTASAAVGRHRVSGNASPRRRDGPRSVVVLGGYTARGVEASDRHLSRGHRGLRKTGRPFHQQPSGELHDGQLRANHAKNPSQRVEESFVWYPKHGAKIIGSVASWLRELDEGLGTYDYLGGTQQRVEDGSLEYLTMDYLLETPGMRRW